MVLPVSPLLPPPHCSLCRCHRRRVLVVSPRRVCCHRRCRVLIVSPRHVRCHRRVLVMSPCRVAATATAAVCSLCHLVMFAAATATAACSLCHLVMFAAATATAACSSCRLVVSLPPPPPLRARHIGSSCRCHRCVLVASACRVAAAAAAAACSLRRLVVSLPPPPPLRARRLASASSLPPPPLRARHVVFAAACLSCLLVGSLPPPPLRARHVALSCSPPHACRVALSCRRRRVLIVSPRCVVTCSLCRLVVSPPRARWVAAAAACLLCRRHCHRCAACCVAVRRLRVLPRCAAARLAAAACALPAVSPSE